MTARRIEQAQGLSALLWRFFKLAASPAECLALLDLMDWRMSAARDLPRMLEEVRQRH